MRSTKTKPSYTPCSQGIDSLCLEAQCCTSYFTDFFSRESLSKEADSALLTVIGYPAFAVEKPAVIEKTMDVVMSKLNREYGCIRFLRDGYKTPREDSSR